MRYFSFYFNAAILALSINGIGECQSIKNSGEYNIQKGKGYRLDIIDMGNAFIMHAHGLGIQLANIVTHTAINARNRLTIGFYIV